MDATLQQATEGRRAMEEAVRQAAQVEANHFDEATRRAHVLQMMRHRNASLEAEERAARKRAAWAEQRRQLVLRDEHIAAEARASRERTRRAQRESQRALYLRQQLEIDHARAQSRFSARLPVYNPSELPQRPASAAPHPGFALAGGGAASSAPSLAGSRPGSRQRARPASAAALPTLPRQQGGGGGGGGSGSGSNMLPSYLQGTLTHAGPSGPTDDDLVRLRAAQELRGAAKPLSTIDYEAAAKAYGRPVGRPRQIVVLNGNGTPSPKTKSRPGVAGPTHGGHGAADRYAPLLQNLKAASREYVALRPGSAGGGSMVPKWNH